MSFDAKISDMKKIRRFVAVVGADDDSLRARLIPAALGHLHQAIADGVPVFGYCHWSLIDNFE